MILVAGLCSQAVPRRLPCEPRDSIQNVKGHALRVSEIPSTTQEKSKSRDDLPGFITELYGVPFLRQAGPASVLRDLELRSKDLYFNGILLHDDGITLDSLGIDDEACQFVLGRNVGAELIVVPASSLHSRYPQLSRKPEIGQTITAKRSARQAGRSVTT